jgi:hypothetical protein
MLILLPAVVWWAVMLAHPVRAIEIAAVRVGFSGSHRVGYWCPVAIDFASVDREFRGRVEIIVPDGAGVWSTIAYHNCVLSPTHTSAHVYMKSGRIRTSLSVRFVADDGTTASRTFTSTEIPQALPSRRRLVVVLGQDVGIEQALRSRRRLPDDTIELALVDIRSHAKDLPVHGIGYSGVDLIVLPTLANSSALRSLRPKQISALAEYLRDGGQILICAGRDAKTLFAPDQPLSALLPAQVSHVQTIRQTAGIEQFVGGASYRLDAPAAERFELEVAVLDRVDGVVELSEGLGTDRKPLVVRGAVGMGQSIFVGFDLDSPNLAAWPDRPLLVRRLLDYVFPATETEDDAGAVPLAARLGYHDLTGQLRAAMDVFPGLTAGRIVPLSIFALVACYLLLVGPVDYLLVGRLFRRYEWTWMTFPICVAAFTWLSWELAWSWKGSRAVLNRLSIFDVDATSGHATGRSWLNLYSPSTESFSLRMQPTVLDSPGDFDAHLSWQGLPGSGFGGMDNHAGSMVEAGRYSLEMQSLESGRLRISVERLPLASWSSRSLIGHWSAESLFDAGQALDLRQVADRQLAGTVANLLPIDLRECLLVHDRWAYSLGTMRAGQARSLVGIPSRDLKTLLTRQEFIEGRYKMSPWNPESTDVDRIGWMMMFYSAINGRTYTGLLNRYHSQIDFSRLLRLNRAVLVGQASDPPDVVLRGDRPLAADEGTSTVFYRLLLPVTTGDELKK